MKAVVISLGGSVLTTFLEYPEKLNKFKRIIHEISRRYKIVLVVGGGSTARKYINVAKDFTENKSILDKIGIAATELNARFLIALLEDVYPKPIKTTDELLIALQNSNIVVCSGNEPGVSTDWDAALFADAIGAKLLINATRVDGIYDKNPTKNKDARIINRLTYSDFFELMKNQSSEPGNYPLFDLSAIKLLERSKIKLVVVNGLEPDNILKAALGKDVGSIVGE
ncbi:MAG: UMP kinase [Candidatus Aenigmarchaeota archaeon]|nr:UMP kinase [Candidatus Aenigmarchaeota archaeon]